MKEKIQSFLTFLLSLKIKKVFIIIFIILILLISFLLFKKDNYLAEVPKQGGEINEIIIGQRPLFINPVLSISTADRDLLTLTHSSLLKRNQFGEIIPGVAKIIPNENSKKYILQLKNNIYFSNGQKLTADDVIFTIKKIQDPLYKSPYISDWLKVEVKKNNDYQIEITLPEEYAQFKNTLADLYIMPKSAWERISPNEFPFNPLNIKPIGSGPYLVKKVIRDNDTGKIKQYILEANRKYFNGKILPEQVYFHYFDNENEYRQSLLFSNRQVVKNISAISPTKVDLFAGNQSYVEKNVRMLALPTIFSLFLGKNYNSNLSNKDLRQAISLVINRNNITENILQGYAKPLLSIDLQYTENYQDEAELANNLTKAKEILKKSIFKFNEAGQLINSKNKKLVEFNLAIVNSSEFKKIAQSIKADLAKIGIKINIISYPENELISEVIRNRNFELLFYGYQLKLNPDYYYIFHSSQKNDPGINIAEISNSTIDKILLELRKKISTEERQEKMTELNKLVLTDYSFIPLYQPYFVYIMDARIKNFNKNILNSVSDRLNNLNEWYILSKKILKN